MFIENAPVTVAMFDREMCYLAASRRWLTDYGLGDIDLRGRSHYEVFPDIPESWKQIHRRCLAGAVEKCDEDRFVRADGTVDWLRWEVRPWRTAQNVIGGIIVATERITDRKEAEVALRVSEERFRQVVENIREVFWMTDTEKNQILYISPGYEKIWGRTCESLYASSRSWIESIHPEDRARVLQRATTQQVAGTYDETYRIVRPDGAVRWVHDRAFPVRDEHDAVRRVVGVAEDVTDRRKLEEQFRQAQKMEAIGTLAGGIAHDFNNILAAIGGYAELAKLEPTITPEVLEHLDAVLTGTHRATDLVRQILAFSRQQDQERRPIQLRHVLHEALKLLRATIPTQIAFNLSLANNTPTVLADPTQVHQVIMNLCTNAAHAMRDRPGRLTVTMENFPVSEEFAAVHPGLRARTYVRVAVTDTGHGMDQATLNRIFEPFFTTKAPGEGTGLGLAVVHGIMQSHEGAVTVYSHPGEGTTFHLYFPAQPEGASPPEIAVPTAPRGRGERILYVDDEPMLATMGRKILERLGYVVDARTSALEALATVRARPAEFDLVITDQMMPGLTGAGLAEQIHALRPDLPIILVTGYAATLTLERVRALGVRKLILKPVSVESLGTAVGGVLAESRSR